MTDVAGVLAPAVRWQNATITRRVMQTPEITSFFVRPDRPFTWRAGQHVDIRLTAEDGYRAIRSYSIASLPGADDELELAVERLADGEVSLWFHDVAQVGDVVEIKGPLGGHFVWEPEDGGPILLIGGGSGLVPLMAIARRGAEAAARVPMHLLLSARSPQDVLYREELEALERQNDRFGMTLALTRASAWRPQDFSRRIDDEILARVLKRLPAWPKRVFVCGTNGFVNAAADGAQAAGVAAEIIRTERYGGL
ncbi:MULTISPECIES: FAD-binding oxidoreductase [Phenylobacterium]|uniref:Ferredoxin-NADP reductase n=1 Tax=Phenylobacterium koreense TaxID=266125 RepID=A0ABV2EG44_9CAUL